MKLYFFLVDENLKFGASEGFAKTATYEKILAEKKIHLISPTGAADQIDQPYLHIYNSISSAFLIGREEYSGHENDEIIGVNRKQAKTIDDWTRLIPQEEADCILLIPKELAEGMYEKLPRNAKPSGTNWLSGLFDAHGARFTLTIDPGKLATQPHPYSFDTLASCCTQCHVLLPSGLKFTPRPPDTLGFPIP